MKSHLYQRVANVETCFVHMCNFKLTFLINMTVYKKTRVYLLIFCKGMQYFCKVTQEKKKIPILKAHGAPCAFNKAFVSVKTFWLHRWTHCSWIRNRYDTKYFFMFILTLPCSLQRVSMTTVWTFFSQTILQNSLTVAGKGPWAAMNSFLER